MTRFSLQRFRQLGQELGALGTAALVVLAAAGVFFLVVLQPMKEERTRLEGALSRNTPKSQTNLGAFYGLLESRDETTDALAKLYAIGKATGVELQSGQARFDLAPDRVAIEAVRDPAVLLVQRCLGEDVRPILEPLERPAHDLLGVPEPVDRGGVVVPSATDPTAVRSTDVNANTSRQVVSCAR